MTQRMIGIPNGESRVSTQIGLRREIQQVQRMRVVNRTEEMFPVNTTQTRVWVNRST